MSGYEIKPLKPLKTPQELRDATIRDYTRWAQKSGLNLSAEQIARVAQNHLAIVDAYNRGVDTTAKKPLPKKQTPVPAIIKPGEEGKARLVAGNPDPYRPSVLYESGMYRGERWGRAMGRIRRILEGMTPSRDLRKMCATAASPVLALRFMTLYADYLTRAKTTRYNPFNGLSDRDASRKLEAMVYDICDASTGFAGSWYTPK